MVREFSLFSSGKILFSKPVIGANIGGIPELVLDGETGFIFEPANVEELKNKLLQLWQDEKRTALMGENARLHAYNLYNFDNHWNKLNSLLTK